MRVLRPAPTIAKEKNAGEAETKAEESQRKAQDGEQPLLDAADANAIEEVRS